MDKPGAHPTGVRRESIPCILIHCPSMLWFNRQVLLLEAGFPMTKDGHCHVAPLATLKRLFVVVDARLEDITKPGYVGRGKRHFLFYRPSSKMKVSFSQALERLIFRGPHAPNVSRAGKE